MSLWGLIPRAGNKARAPLVERNERTAVAEGRTRDTDPQRATPSGQLRFTSAPGKFASRIPKAPAFPPSVLRAHRARDWLHLPHVTLSRRRRLPGRRLESWRPGGVGAGPRGRAPGKHVPDGAGPPPSPPPREGGAAVGPEGRGAAEPSPQRKIPTCQLGSRCSCLPFSLRSGLSLRRGPRTGPAASRQ